MSEFKRTEGDAPWDGGAAVDAGVPPRTVTGKAGATPTAAATDATGRLDTAQNSTAPPGTPSTPAPPPRRSWLRRGLRAVLLGSVAIVIVYAALIVLYRFVNPPASTLMLIQRAGGDTITRTWVPIERISPHLVRAVIMSEDAGFCRHAGVDWRELFEVIERSGDGIARGGSTISMQTAKNLFLWPARNYLRKAMEIPLTLGMELVWPKHRMLEIYLNIVEWGPGIFGAEAAARHHFNKPASRLTEQEAALLAVSLPAPLVREPGSPSAQLLRMADVVRGRMRNISRHATCVLGDAPKAR